MVIQIPMTGGGRTDHRNLGWCPRCRKPVPTDNLVIRYEDAQQYTVFARCMNCEHVVTPRDRDRIHH